MPEEQLKSIIEALLIVSSKPVSMNDLKSAFEANIEISTSQIKKIVDELAQEYDQQKRGCQITEIAGKFQICTRSDWAPWIKRFLEDKKEDRLSQPALETLAIVAYRQPITKMEIESIRGVNVDGMLKSLLDKGLVKVGGKKDILGRPFIYITTERFLEYFGLRSITDLPRKDEINYEKKDKQEQAGQPQEAEETNRQN